MTQYHLHEKVAEIDAFLLSDKRAYSRWELKQLFKLHRSAWQLKENLTDLHFIKFLLSEGILSEIKLRSEKNTSLKRYKHPKATAYHVALSVKPKPYLSHGSALFFQSLTNQLLKTIYINQEQMSPGWSTSALTQERINFAFSKNQRVSQSSYDYEGHRIVIINGKNTDWLGVEYIRSPEGDNLPVTNLERTLIDAVVRPIYAGGITQVLEAYQNSKDHLSIAKMIKLIKKLNYIYPYHQAIGFLLERVGFQDSELAPFNKMERQFDFFLTHGMKLKEYDPKWKLFYPKGF